MSILSWLRCRFADHHVWTGGPYDPDNPCELSRLCVSCFRQVSEVKHRWGEWTYKAKGKCDQERICTRQGCTASEKRVLHSPGQPVTSSTNPCEQTVLCTRCSSVQSKTELHDWQSNRCKRCGKEEPPSYDSSDDDRDETARGAGEIAMTGLPSDERLKANIMDVDGAVTQLERLRPVSFEYRHDDPSSSLPKGMQFGFVAQELEHLYPGMVATDCNGMRRVNYSAFVALLVAAVQQQQRQIAELRTRVEGRSSERPQTHAE